MKIAVVIPNYGPVGGAENFAYQLCERLALQKDFEIHVLANRFQPAESRVFFHKIPIVIFPRFLRPLSFAYFVEKHLQKGGYDLVHSHDRIFNMDILSFHGIPHATWVRATKRDRLCLYDRAVAWVEKKGITASLQPLILPVSSLVMDELQKTYPLPNERIKLMSPGVTIKNFSLPKSQTVRKDMRFRLGLSEEDIVLLFVSMNFELKRLRLIIKSLAQSVIDHPQGKRLKLLIVGKGREKRYIKMAEKLGVADRLIFAGKVTDIAQYYFAGDIFVMPSQYDTFAMVVLEAMAAGLPVIITKNVGAKDLVRDGVNGYVLSESPSVSDLANKIDMLLDRQLRVLMGEKNRSIAEKYDWDEKAEWLAQLYRELT